MCRFCEQTAFGQQEAYDPQLGRGGFVPGANMPPDLILTGGPILTMDEARPEALAIAIREGVIQALGTADEMLSRRGRVTRVIGLEGRALLPGFIGSGMRLPLRREAASLDRWIEARARAGFTTVELTALAPGWTEFDGLSRQIERRHRLRLRGAAGERLRQDWRRGTLAPGYGNDLLRIETMRLRLSDTETTLARALQLHAEGWGVVLECDETAGLIALAALAGSRPLPGLRVIAPEGKEADAPLRRTLREAGLEVIEPAPDLPAAGLTGPREAVLARIAALTRDAARRAGMAGIAGQLRPGAYADFTLLDRSPFWPGSAAPRVVGTWIEGIPVRPEADHVAS